MKNGLRLILSTFNEVLIHFPVQLIECESDGGTDGRIQEYITYSYKLLFSKQKQHLSLIYTSIGEPDRIRCFLMSFFLLRAHPKQSALFFSCQEHQRHNKSQSCAVTKSSHFWRASGQSILVDRMEDCFTGQSTVV